MADNHLEFNLVKDARTCETIRRIEQSAAPETMFKDAIPEEQLDKHLSR
jgi:hypothetical protein